MSRGDAHARVQALAPILPPRPNLGPEPWPRPAWPIGWTVGSVAAALLALGTGWLWLRRRRARRARAVTVQGPPSPESDGPLTPRQEMARWSDAVRAALVARFGPEWAAKTTEEIAAEPALADQLGVEPAGRLSGFLRAADQAKFADPAADPEPDAWAPWIAWAADFCAVTDVAPSRRPG